MNNERNEIRFIFYTLGVALLPLLTRMVLASWFSNGAVQYYTIGDLVCFGLVIVTSSWSELDNFINEKNFYNTMSYVVVLFMILFVLLLGVEILKELPNVKDSADQKTIERWVFMLCLSSFAVWFTIYIKTIKKMNQKQTE